MSRLLVTLLPRVREMTVEIENQGTETTTAAETGGAQDLLETVIHVPLAGKWR